MVKSDILHLYPLINIEFIIDSRCFNYGLVKYKSFKLQKEDIYRKIDEICGNDVCFGANSSCISITKIGSVTRRSNKVIVMNFMNPVFLKSSIEVIRGFHIFESTIE